MEKPALYGCDPVTGDQRSWAVSSDIGAFALLAGPPSAVVALREGLFKLDFASASLVRLAPPSFDPALFRFNEGACDAAGRFWVGVMFDPFDEVAARQKGALQSFTLGAGLRQQPDLAELHNGMPWSRDGAVFYLSHSYRREMFAHAFDLHRGLLGARRLFARIPEGFGISHGAAVDTEGGYWCALHGGARLRRFTGAGKIDRDIELPASQPTMCACAGPGLDDLYVTSAADKLTPEQRRRESLAGALLRLRPGETGVSRAYLVR